MIRYLILMWMYLGPSDDCDIITLESIQFYYGWGDDDGEEQPVFINPDEPTGPDYDGYLKVNDWLLLK